LTHCASKDFRAATKFQV